MRVEGAGTATSGKRAGSIRIADAMNAAVLQAMALGVDDPAEILRRKLAARDAAKAQIEKERAEAHRAAKIAELMRQRAEIDRQLRLLGGG